MNPVTLEPLFWDYAARLIALNTALPQGNCQIEGLLDEVMATLFADYSPRIQRQYFTAEGATHVNYMASFGPEETGGLLWVTHTDTVPPGPLSAWTRGAPFELTQVVSEQGEAQVIGLGVADVKLDLLCKLLGLKRLLDSGATLTRPLHVMASGCEEVGLVGAREFVASAEFKRIAPRYVMCSEPSELALCDAHKGYAVAQVLIPMTDIGSSELLSTEMRTLQATGKAAHSATPHLGENAILKLLEQLSHSEGALHSISGGVSSNTVPAKAEATLQGSGDQARTMAITLLQLWQRWCEFSRALTPAADPAFTPQHVVNNFGTLKIEQGQLVATFDARLLPAHDPYLLLSAFHEAAESAGVKSLTKRCNAGMQMAKECTLITTVQSVLRRQGLDDTPHAKPTSTEAGVFARAGCEAVVLGPGVSIGNAHCPNEFGRVRDFALAIELYRGVAELLCTDKVA